MSASRREWAGGSILAIDEAADLADPISTDNGEARLIAPLRGNPDFLAKLYKTPRGDAEATRLDRLISIPEDDGPATMLRGDSSWPVARIRSEHHACTGVVIPRAPERFRAQVQSGTTLVERYLDVDLLAKPADALVKRGLTAPTPPDRLTAAGHIVRIGAAMESLGLVYSDWSYSNAFWAPQDWSIYLIDVDGCAFTTTTNLCQPNWEDPLTPRVAPADTYVDRYRVALLTARCLTARRDRLQAARALVSETHCWNRATAEVLLDILLARERRHRPSLGTLRIVLEGGPYVFVPGRRTPLPPEPQITVVAGASLASNGVGGPNVRLPGSSKATPPSVGSTGVTRPGVPKQRSKPTRLDIPFAAAFTSLGMVTLLIIILAIANR
jgi:hypothetical protein